MKNIPATFLSIFILCLSYSQLGLAMDEDSSAEGLGEVSSILDCLDSCIVEFKNNENELHPDEKTQQLNIIMRLGELLPRTVNEEYLFDNNNHVKLQEFYRFCHVHELKLKKWCYYRSENLLNSCISYVLNEEKVSIGLDSVFESIRLVAIVLKSGEELPEDVFMQYLYIYDVGKSWLQNARTKILPTKEGLPSPQLGTIAEYIDWFKEIFEIVMDKQFRLSLLARLIKEYSPSIEVLEKLIKEKSEEEIYVRFFEKKIAEQKYKEAIIVFEKHLKNTSSKDIIFAAAKSYCMEAYNLEKKLSSHTECISLSENIVRLRSEASNIYTGIFDDSFANYLSKLPHKDIGISCFLKVVYWQFSERSYEHPITSFEQNMSPRERGLSRALHYLNMLYYLLKNKIAFNNEYEIIKSSIPILANISRNKLPSEITKAYPQLKKQAKFFKFFDDMMIFYDLHKELQNDDHKVIEKYIQQHYDPNWHW